MNVQSLVDKVIYVPIPYIYNLDYKSITDLIGIFNISSCDIWYMFEFDKKVS
jgi:hypothetical protein